MNLEYKRSVLSSIIWFISLILLILIVFLVGSVTDFPSDKGRVVMSAIVIGVSYLFQFSMILITKRRNREVPRDERDIRIGYKGNSIAFILVLAYAFAMSIFLYEKYKLSGVPAGYLYFLAYSLVCMAFLSSSILSVILYVTGRVDE